VDLKIPSTVSAEAQDLITRVRPSFLRRSPSLTNVIADRQLLQHDPEKRLALDKVAVHPWITRYIKKESTGSKDV
jgi:hypothetical protein